MTHYYNEIVFAAGWPYWLFFLLSLITLVVFFILRERRIRRASAKEITIQHTLTNLELHAFQAHMDPHFIFNSLNAIHHYILTTSTDMASLYLTRFSRLMRLMIGNFNKEWVSLYDDLEALELYIQLEQLRFDHQFSYQVEILPEVNQQFSLVPPLIIQPYVQYAIWHRLLLRPQKSGGHLLIIIGRENDRLFIQVEDNGVLTTELLDDTGERQASGIDIAAERLYMMSEKYHMLAGIQAQQLLDEQQEPCGNRLTISMQHMASRQSMAG
ncbi:histidine kinase [Chitinophaga sp. MM2321]|uniref:sensor histidine kinase n=1 Tax=Chitinophaga sp. MM2321 TaxID=3137178 RepID=UPI0032D57974